MKIAVVSDTHDNLINFKKIIFLVKKEKIKTLIHCGDVFEPETIKEAEKDFDGEIFISLSPEDEYYFKGLKKDFFGKAIKFWSEFGEIKLQGKQIAFCHLPETAKKLTASRKYDIIFYGHTHFPWEKKINKIRIINPGNSAGLFFPSTFAIIDLSNDNLKLKRLT